MLNNSYAKKITTVSHPAYIPVCQLHCHLAVRACTVQRFCFEKMKAGSDSEAVRTEQRNGGGGCARALLKLKGYYTHTL